MINIVSWQSYCKNPTKQQNTTNSTTRHDTSVQVAVNEVGKTTFDETFTINSGHGKANTTENILLRETRKASTYVEPLKLWQTDDKLLETTSSKAYTSVLQGP